MKAIIFAGGAGTRLWPLSRKDSPKQFEKVVGEKSTLQLAVENLMPRFGWKDIFISTNESYVSHIYEQLPYLPRKNVIGEPEGRDVGPAVGLMTAIFHKLHPDIPLVILWSDHIIKKKDLFAQILTTSEKIVQKNKEKIIFIGQRPRFGSQNLGWIKYGKISKSYDKLNFYSFESFSYRPPLEKAVEFYKSGSYAWNVGYFVTTPRYLWKQFENHQSEIHKSLVKIYKAVGTSSYSSVVKKVYPMLPRISFDNAILEKIDKNSAWVISEDLGWSDIGAWEALKEALQSAPSQNVTKGKVLVTDCQDSLVYNYTDQLVVTIDLVGLMVVNTHDVVMICHKNSVPKIKKLVEKLSESKNDHLV